MKVYPGPWKCIAGVQQLDPLLPENTQVLRPKGRPTGGGGGGGGSTPEIGPSCSVFDPFPLSGSKETTKEQNREKKWKPGPAHCPWDPGPGQSQKGAKGAATVRIQVQGPG